MLLKIDQEILLLLQEEELTIEDLFVLQALNMGEIELLDVLDQNLQNMRINILCYQKLFRRSYIEACNDSSEQLWVLTKKSVEFLNKLNN